MFIGLFILFTLSIGQVHFLDAEPGDYLEMWVNYRSTAHDENAHVTVYIPDLNIYDRSNTFDVHRGDNGVRVMFPFFEEDVQSGWYPVWTMLSSDSDRTWQFDWVYVQ